MLDEKDIKIMDEKMDAKLETMRAEILNGVKVLLETEVSQKLNAVYEKLDAMDAKMDALAPKSRVEALEDELEFLKSVIRAHGKEIAELKKAQ